MAQERKLQPKTLSGTVSRLVRTQQFYWFLGHVAGIVFFTLNALSAFYSRSVKYYKGCLLAELITYGIVIRQIHFKKSGVAGLANVAKDKQLRIKLVRDDNVQYFTLALIFYFSSGVIGGVSGGLYSFVIFSVFHTLTYFQTNLLGSMPMSISAQQELNTRINHFTSTYNQQALMIAANAEFLLLSGFVFTVPFMFVQVFRAPIFVLVNTFVFASVVAFLKLRYISNQYTQSIISLWDLKINQILLSGKLPQSFSQFYNVRFKLWLHTLTDPIQLPQLSSAKKST